MAVYIDVIVDISVNSLDRIFQYRVPEELLDAVTVGCQVNVYVEGNRDRGTADFSINDEINPSNRRYQRGDLAGVQESCETET